MALLEGLVLDGLDLNSASLVLEDLLIPPPPKRQEWVTGGDVDGAALVRDPLFDNREITVKVRVSPTATMDAAIARVIAISKKLEETEQNADGLPLVWTPANATSGITFYVLSAVIDGLPVEVVGEDAGWFVNSPVVTFKLACKPFGYGAEIGGENLVTNPSFETNATGWDRPRSNAWAAVGTYSCIVSGDAAGSNPAVTYQSLVPCKPGQRFTCIATINQTVLSPSGEGFRFVAVALDGAGNYLGEFGPSWQGNNSVGVKTMITQTGAAPAGTTRVQFAIQHLNAQGTWYFDAVLVSAEAVASYFDGDTPGYAWTGTPHASTSVGPNAVTGSGPFATVNVSAVGGDVPAEGRLIVYERSAQSRRYVEWGLEQRNYQPATSLLVDSDDMTTTGLAGAQATRTGAYDSNNSGSNVVRATLQSSLSAICGTGSLTQIGTFRVKARVYASGDGARVRLSWRDGDGSLRANAFATPSVSGAFAEVDLGIVSVRRAQAGQQQWSGQVEALTTTAGVTLDVDHLVLVPAGEGYGRARASLTPQTGINTAFDTFSNATPGDVLNGRTAEGGGTWSSAGGGTDFTVDSGLALTRSAQSADGQRLATLGAAINGAVTVMADVAAGTFTKTAAQYGLVARYVDASNYLLAVLVSSERSRSAQVVKVIAGTATVLATGAPASRSGRLGATVDASGRCTVTLDGQQLVTVADADLATGGALANGKPGIAHTTTLGTKSISFDNVLVAVTPTAPPALYPGRAVEFRSDGSAIRQDATGMVYGAVPAYRGSRFVIPPAGDKVRTSRILVKADRNDLEAGADEPLGDAITVQVRYTPRYATVGVQLLLLSAPLSSGSPYTGSTLTTTSGQWSMPASFAYQWLRNGAAIPGATLSAYTLQTADEGANITCVVTATAVADQGLIASANSNAITSFAPAAIPNMSARYSPETLPGTNNGDAIATWPDASGNNRTLTQGTASQKPAYRVSGAGGRPAARFDATDDSLVQSYGPPATCTVFTVYAPTSLPATGGRVANTPATNWLIGPYSGSHSFYNGAFVGTPVAASVGVAAVVAGRQSTTGPASTLWVNGSQRGAVGSGAPSAPAQLGMGAQANYPEPAYSDVSEMIVYERALTDAEMLTVSRYLGSKYGVAVA